MVLVARVAMAGRLGVLAPLRGMIRLLSREFGTVAQTKIAGKAPSPRVILQK